MSGIVCLVYVLEHFEDVESQSLKALERLSK